MTGTIPLDCLEFCPTATWILAIEALLSTCFEGACYCSSLLPTVLAVTVVFCTDSGHNFEFSVPDSEQELHLDSGQVFAADSVQKFTLVHLIQASIFSLIQTRNWHLIQLIHTRIFFLIQPRKLPHSPLI
ncbi:hypothetical protein M9H77_02822 [Catharanthus roseus]|uniref:Uncharacterized protein n=1 Tax=Catharanthus roseus TaxID=4058 RepID=A0ACC0C9M3_CATRO|nr:hypothetical protein M9H77_02822 [Catharanthus roseus]